MNPDSMAFGQHGTVYVGTQCGGVAIGTPMQGHISVPGDALGWSYYQWNVIKGPWHMPLTATGNGLPGNLINSVTTTWPHHIAVATDEGIALGKCVGVPQSAATAQSAMFSRGHSARASSAARTVSSLNIHLTFEHGQNFVAKVHGLWHPPVHWNPPPEQLLTKLPTEDHTTVVAWQSTPMAVGHPARQESQAASSSMGKAGYLWLGHWRTGLDVWQYNTQGKIIDRWQIHEPQVGNYIQSLLPLKGGAMAVGCYGKGIKIITLPGQSQDAWKTGGEGNKANAGQRMAMATAQPAAANAPEPQGARPPSARELDNQLRAISTVDPAPSTAGGVLPLSGDWRTGGDWIDRYGRYWGCLFAAGTTSIRGINWVHRHHGDRVHMYATVGHGGVWGEGLRYWIYSLKSANRRSLQFPRSKLPTPLRSSGAARNSHLGRETECDDHGEMYSTNQSGPGIVCRVQIPAGLFEIGLYDVNFDGHSGADRMRDYVLSAAGGRGHQISSTSILARRSRIDLFFNGVYAHWLVWGPTVFHLNLKRNHSFNTIVVGMFVDRVNAGRCPSPRAEHLLKAWASPGEWHRLTRKRNTSQGAARALAAILPLMAKFNFRWYAANWCQGYTELLRWDVERLTKRNPDPAALSNATRLARRLSLFRLARHLQMYLGFKLPTG